VLEKDGLAYFKKRKRALLETAITRDCCVTETKDFEVRPVIERRRTGKSETEL
jgi:hypothetical protein